MPNDAHEAREGAIDLNEVFGIKKDESVILEYEATIEHDDSGLQARAPENETLRGLAQRHRPPQEWYDNDDDPFDP